MIRITHWWPKLTPDSREWLSQHLDQEVPIEIMAEIVLSGEGWAGAMGWAAGEHVNSSGFVMPAEAREWIVKQIISEVVVQDDPTP